MTKEPRLRIAYFCMNDPLDKRSWSGTTYYLGQTLQRNVGEVDFLGPVRPPWILDKALRGLAKASRLFLRSEWIPKYSYFLNRYAASVLAKRMKGKQYDVLVAPASAPQLGLLKTELPVIYFGDSTFHCYSENYHKEFNNMGAITRWEGNWMEKKALKNSDLVIMTSEWARDSAVNDYGIPSSLIEILLLGANIDFIPPIESIFEKEKTTPLTLLFLAVDWDRKGGKLALETLEQLQQLNVPAKLIVCGCQPPDGLSNPDMEVIPFLNKNLPEDHARFTHLLSSAHFLLLPTRADCSLLVACEANSYGMPAITTRVGGVPDVVNDGVNGYCLPFEADGLAYARLIQEIYSDKPRYHALIASSRRRFDEQLNWDKFAEQFIKVYERRFGNEGRQSGPRKASVMPTEEAAG
jgi:glycosyltransferase involved in cell wall biosynthesis